MTLSRTEEPEYCGDSVRLHNMAMAQLSAERSAWVRCSCTLHALVAVSNMLFGLHVFMPWLFALGLAFGKHALS